MFYIRKSVHKIFVIFLIMIWMLSFIYNGVHKAYIKDEVQVVDVTKASFGFHYKVSYQFKYYELSSQQRFMIGDIIYVEASVEKFRKQTIAYGFNTYAYKKGLNIHGSLKVNDIRKTREGFHPNQISSQLIKLDVAFFNLILDNHLNVDAGYLDYLFKLSGMMLYAIKDWIKRMGYYLNLSNHWQSFACLICFLVLWILNPTVVTITLFINQAVSCLFDFKHIEYTNLDIKSITCIITLLSAPYLIYNQSFILIYLIMFFYEFRSDKQYLNPYLATLLLIPFYILWDNKLSLFVLCLSPLLFKYVKRYLIYIALIMSIFPYMPIDRYMRTIFEFLNAITNLFPHITLPTMPLWLMILYYLFWIWILRYHQKVRLCILLLIILVLYTANQCYRPDFIYFLDVGQGDSAIMRYQGKIIVVDAYQYVEKTLRSMGVDIIDYLILTHSDEDHVKEAKTLIANFDVKTIYINAYNTYDIINQRLIFIGKHHLPKLPEIALEFISPYQVFETVNDNSLVFYIRFNQTTVLFTGDISNAVEHVITKTHPQLKVDILKVAHHGSVSSSSTQFITAIKPTVAIISSSMDNKYQHPHQDVLKRFKDQGTKVYQTRYDGSIKVMFDDDKAIFTCKNKPY